MNRFVTLLLASFLLMTGIIACHDKGDDCTCKSNEVCIPNAYTGVNECYLYESVHELGGTRVIAPNSYEGITSNNLCVDTMIFYNDTSRAIDDERFGLIVADPPQGVINVLGSDVPFEVSNTEYFGSTSAPMCYLNGKGWYANLHYFLYPDSVRMELRFWTLENDPGEFVDSTVVMFFRKK